MHVIQGLDADGSDVDDDAHDGVEGCDDGMVLE
jgi:hypothetical protein